MELVKLVNNLLPSVYPKWTDKLEPRTPMLMDRVPDATPVLANVQKVLKVAKTWQGGELTQIVPWPQAEPGKLLVWTLNGKVADPMQEAELIALCHDVVVQMNPWWKRAKDRLDIKSACAVKYPSPDPLVKHIRESVDNRPGVARLSTEGNCPDGLWRWCERRWDRPVIMTWSLVGDVYNPGQGASMSLVQEEHCRINPAWKNYAGLRFEDQLKQVPVDPTPVLKVLQAKLAESSGWAACQVTALEAPPCASDQVDNQTWEIIGTVAFLAQQTEMPNLVDQAFGEVYPGWGLSADPKVDPNRMKVGAELRPHF